jgi:hypothetical protein
LAFSLLALAGILVYVDVPVAFSQVTTAAIHGTVIDPSEAVIPGAKVTALDTSTGIATETTTNKSGFYTFPALQIGGPYKVTVEAPGFQKLEKTGIMLTVNANLEENATLKVGSSLQTVEVNASAVQVETTNTQLEQVMPATQIENLPMLERDAASMERLAPGVVESSDRFGSYSVNGSQTTSNSFLLDGIDNNDGPLQDEEFSINPDALAQQNTVESTINPEFSRNGGAVVNQVVKSGTNQIHGSGFEYYRDTFMNLGGYFALPGVRVPYHRNLYGGTLGGPIVKNRFFGFAAYQGYRARAGVITDTPVFQSSVYDATTKTFTGNFSTENNIANSGQNGTVGLTDNVIPFKIKTGTGASIGSGITCGPGTGYTTWDTCFPVGTPVVIGTSSFNSIAESLTEKYVPPGNAGKAIAPFYSFPTADSFKEDQGVLKADYHISDKDAISGTGIFQSSPATDTLPFGGATLPGFGMVNAEHFKLFAASETHTFSSKTLNVLRAGYMRLIFAAVQPANVVAPSSLGFAIYPQSSSSGVPNMALTGLFTLGFSYEGPQPRKDTNLTYSDNFSHIFGNHDLRLGATIEQFRVSNPYYADNNGVFGYAGAGTYSSGDPGIDFLLGIPDSYTQSSGGFVDEIAWEYYFFAQDSWRATSDLTLNYGLAWDVETPNINTQFNGLGITCFVLGTQTSTVFTGGFPGLLWPGDPGCNKAGGATTHYDHFGPRFGFAWSPSKGPSGLIGAPGAHKLSIRGGFGLYFNRDQEEGQLQNLGDTPNFKLSYGAKDFGGSPAFANPFADVTGCTGCSETNPFPYVRPHAGAALDWSLYTGQDTSAIDKNYATPYIYNFNLNIQRQLPGNMVMQVGYVGSVGHRLATVYEADPITAAGQAACLADPTCIAYRAYQHYFYPSHTAQPYTYGGYPDYLSIGTLATYGASNYNSLQASLVKNTSHGLYFTLAYTYSHGLDNASGLESSGFNYRSMNNVPGFQYLNYGDSDYDARHRLVASYDYKIPLLASMNQNFAVKEILGDWHVAGLTVEQTGFPILITDAGVYRSLWCDAFAYYYCPDDVNTSLSSLTRIQKYNPRANVNGLNQYFDTSSFYQEAIGTFGNVGRNPFHGPGFNYTNLSLYKNLPLGHDTARSIQISLQAANVFNHANFAQPDGNFTDGPYFGTISSVKVSADYNGDPFPGRTAQIVGKITF